MSKILIENGRVIDPSGGESSLRRLYCPLMMRIDPHPSTDSAQSQAPAMPTPRKARENNASPVCITRIVNIAQTEPSTASIEHKAV